MFEFTEEDRALAQVMGDYWAQFAKSGDPNLSPHPAWPAFTAKNQRQMRLGVGDDLGAAAIDRLVKYELIQRRLLRLIDGLKRLREGEPEAAMAQTG